MVVSPRFQFDIEGFCKKAVHDDSSGEQKCHLATDLDLTRFQHFLVAITSSPYNGSLDQIWNRITLAFVTGRFLIISNDYFPLPSEKWRNRKVGMQFVGKGDTRKVIDLLGERDRSASTTSSGGEDCNVLDKPSALAWINELVLSVGFDSGLVLCCNCEMQSSFCDSLRGDNEPDEFESSGSVDRRIAKTSSDVLLEFRGQISSVRSIKSLNETIWILYENGYLVALPEHEALTGKHSSLKSFKMTGHEAVYDLAFCSISSALCNVQQRFFDAKNETELEASTAATDPSQGLLIAGAVNALSLYHLGSRLHFQDAEKLKQYVNDKANSLLSRSFSSFFGYNSSSSEGYSSSSRLSIPESPSAGVYRTEQRAVTLSSLMDFQDVRRRILRLSSDPCGTGLVAAADSLGRVTLFDSNASYYCIVRLWKGLRDARFAWSTVQHSSSAANTSTSSSIGSETAVGQGPARHGRLCLSIYAPQLGLVSMYAMRHGPCLRIIPVGMHCHLETLLSYGNDCGTAITPIVKTILLRSHVESCSVEMVELNPIESSDEDLDVDDQELVFSERRSMNQRNSDVDVFFGSARDEEDLNCEEAESEGTIFKLVSEERQQEKENSRTIKKIRRELTSLSYAVQESRHSDRDVETFVVDAIQDLVLKKKYSSITTISKDFLFLQRALSMVEAMELFGALDRRELPLENYDSSNPIVFSIHIHKAFLTCFRYLIEGIEMILSSPIFDHNSLNGSEGGQLMHQISAELQSRELSLSAYEQLLELVGGIDHGGEEISKRDSTSSVKQVDRKSSSASSTWSAESASSESNIAAAICRENTVRAEALCWTLRASKKMARLNSKDHPRRIDTAIVSEPTESTSAVSSPSLNMRKGAVSPMLATVSNDSSVLLANSQGMKGGPLIHSAVLLSATPMIVAPTQNNIVRNESTIINHEIATQSCFSNIHPVSYSVFRSLFFFLTKKFSILDNRKKNGVVVNFKSTTLLEMIATADECSGFIVSNPSYKLLAKSLFNESMKNYNDDESRIITCTLPSFSVAHQPSIAYGLLHLIISPLALTESLFAANKYANISFKYMGLADSGESLKQLVPLFFCYLQHQTVTFLITDVLVKQKSLSPFQRWMRDALLTFQDSISSLGTYFKNLVNVNQREPEDWDHAELTQSNAEAGEATAQRSLVSDLLDESTNPLGRGESEGQSRNHTDSFLESEDMIQFEKLSRLTAAMNADVNNKEESSDHNLSMEEFLSSLPALPSYDDYVRFVLRPSWLLVRTSRNLEAALTLTAVVVEILHVVNDQVERRTYGASNLKRTISEWDTLVRQIRVCLFLSSRVNGEMSEPFTVRNIDEGIVSLHRLLALDTLCFAPTADAALEHEVRCQDVFLHRVAAVTEENNAIDKSRGIGKDKESVLAAWGPVADKRWRDLLAFAVSEDTFLLSDGNTAVQNGPTMKQSHPNPQINAQDPKRHSPQPVRRRKPLLLFFPQHTQLKFLGAYRGIILSERWSKKITQMHLLVSASEHVFQLPTVCRAAVSAEILKKFVVPVIAALMRLEEADPSPENDDLGITQLAQGQEQISLPPQKLLLNIISDKEGNQLKLLVRSSMEFLNFVEAAVQSFTLPRDALDGKDDLLARGNGEVGGHSRGMDNHESRLRIQSLIESKRNAAATGENSPMADSPRSAAIHRSGADGQPAAWPPEVDPTVSAIYENFHVGVMQNWSKAVIQMWSAALWVMQLRFQCGLRGVRPSALMGPESMREIMQDATSPSASSGDAVPSVVHPLRIEFLNQCLRRLSSVESSAPVYNLAALWRLHSGVVRVLHIAALIDKGGSRDEDAAAMVPQVAARERNLLLDATTCCLRMRLGLAIARVDKLSAFGSLISLMDSEAVTWARDCVPREKLPDAATLEEIAKGRVKPFSLNLPSTRHLVLSLQSLLLAVPLKERLQPASSSTSLDRDLAGVYTLLVFHERRTASSPSSPTASSVPSSSAISSSAQASWFERKERCDALLSLCNSFSQWSNAAK